MAAVLDPPGQDGLAATPPGLSVDLSVEWQDGPAAAPPGPERAVPGADDAAGDMAVWRELRRALLDDGALRAPVAVPADAPGASGDPGAAESAALPATLPGWFEGLAKFAHKDQQQAPHKSRGAGRRWKEKYPQEHSQSKTRNGEKKGKWNPGY